MASLFALPDTEDPIIWGLNERSVPSACTDVRFITPRSIPPYYIHYTLDTIHYTLYTIH